MYNPFDISVKKGEIIQKEGEIHQRGRYNMGDERYRGRVTKRERNKKGGEY